MRYKDINFMISLINATNYVDKNGHPVGHTMKTMTEIKGMLHDKRVELVASKEYISGLHNNKKTLPYSLKADEQYSVIKTLCNYFISLFKSKGDILLYVVVSEPILWGIALLKMNRKIVIITYENWDTYIRSNIKNNLFRKFLVERGLKRVDGCIVTVPSYIPKTKYVRIPDYYISDDMLIYSKRKKKDGCICIGEIRFEKNVPELAKVMSKTDIKLVIAGSFSTKELYYKTRKYRSEQIEVINKNMDYGEYMDYLSGYKYVVLPYDMRYYSGRTSGVLLEAIFVGAIPIAPISLLEENKIQGLGYKRISDIPDLIRKYENGDIAVNNDLEKYKYEDISRRLNEFLKSCC